MIYGTLRCDADKVANFIINGVIIFSPYQPVNTIFIFPAYIYLFLKYYMLAHCQHIFQLR